MPGAGAPSNTEKRKTPADARKLLSGSNRGSSASPKRSSSCRTHGADYALEGRYYKLDVLADIDQAENAIVQFERTDLPNRRDFAAHVLFRGRSS